MNRFAPAAAELGMGDAFPCVLRGWRRSESGGWKIVADGEVPPGD